MERSSAEELDRLARKRAGAKLGWYVHAAAFIIVNLANFAVSEHAFGHRSWSIKPLLGWGLGLTLHGVSVFSWARAVVCASAWCSANANVCSAGAAAPEPGKLIGWQSCSTFCRQ